MDQQPTTPAKPRWGQERRLEFIDFRLLWDGKVNRFDLVAFFGISVQQASIDIARYVELAPRNAAYDKREKSYVATREFEPIRTAASSSHYLNQLLAVSREMMSPEMSFIGWYPGFGAVLSPSRSVDPHTLRRMLSAIRNHQAIEIHYQSMTRPEPTTRWISPHAVAYDGHRWHVRAYCHERKEFRDFVFARMLRLGDVRPSDASVEDDTAWNTMLELILGANPDLPAQQRKQIELDYGMVNGASKIQCRKSLLFYMLQRLGLEHERGAPAEKNKRRKSDVPQAHQIVLLNRQELEQHLRDTA
jgi:hypothetical protein